VLSLLFALTMRPARDVRKRDRKEAVMPLAELLRVPGLPAVLIASMMIITALDLLVIYLPILGTERSMDVALIGYLLTMRSAASLVSRLFYARMVAAIRHAPLMIISSLIGAMGYIGLALPLPTEFLFVSAAIIGFALGIASTLTITTVVDMTTEGIRATANSLRIMGNRLGQVALPFGASLVATAAGVAGIFVVIAAALIASAAGMHFTRPKQ